MAWGIATRRETECRRHDDRRCGHAPGRFLRSGLHLPRSGKLPVLFVVEDNKYGISSPTRKINPRALDVLQPNDWQEIDGNDVQAVYNAGAEAFEAMRAGGGPAFFWVNMERLSSHTSSDDHKLYRSAEELEDLEKCDPLEVLEASN